MGVDVVALLVAIAVPAVGLAALLGLIAGLKGLQRSRDELTELGLRR